MDDGQEYESPQPDDRTQKRIRSAEWPLSNEFANKVGLGNSAAFLTRRSSTASLNSGWKPETLRQHVPGRPSRFQEGSMNDRASVNPPPAFTEGYDAVGRYLAEQENISYLADPDMPHSELRPRDKLRRQKPSVSQNSCNTAESQRSGIWRFGKAIADWFNYNRSVREEDEKARQKRILERRQEKAMKVYEELKKTGQLGALGKRGTRSSANLTAPGCHQTDWSRPSINNRDSGVDVDEGRHFDKQGDTIHSPNADQMLMPPPSLPVRGRSGTPSSVISPSARQSAFSFRKPSIPNLKKVKSEAQLPSSNYAMSFVASPSNRGLDEAVASNVLRKQPSKKDLQKQQKLSQKVSDLESKLQAARRELSLALGEAEPAPYLPSSAATRKAFAAGALPSLPSENLALRGVSGHSEVGGVLEKATGDAHSKTPMAGVATSQVSKANTVGGAKASKAKLVVKTTPKPVVKVESARGSRKRKSTGGAACDSKYKPGSDTEDDLTEMNLSNQVSKRRPKRQKKLQKTNSADSMGSVAMRTKPTSQAGEKGSVIDDPRSDILSATAVDDSVTLGSPPPPRSSLRSKSHDPSVPPVPKLPASIERLVKLTGGGSGDVSTNVDPEKRPQPRQSLEPYEWPEDVF